MIFHICTQSWKWSYGRYAHYGIRVWQNQETNQVWKKEKEENVFSSKLLFFQNRGFFCQTRLVSLIFAKPLYQKVCIDHRITFTFSWNSEKSLLITIQIWVFGVFSDLRFLCLFQLFIRETVFPYDILFVFRLFSYQLVSIS